MTTQPTQQEFWWSFVAICGLLLPAGMLILRQRVMCPTLELRAFDFLPLSGVVHGYSPHLVYRIMHDLTHPVLLLGYAIVLTYLAVRQIVRPVSARIGRVLNYGLPSLHLIFCGSYFGSMFLPIGDLVSVVSP